jgi:1,4-alpha-glucan branching enzyme
MSSGTMVDYAVKRTQDHIGRFNRLYGDLLNQSIDEEWLAEIESRDNIFPNLNFRQYLTKTPA